MTRGADGQGDSDSQSFGGRNERPGEMPDGMPGDLPEDMPGGMTSDLPEDMPGGMPSDLPEDMPGGMTSDLPEDMPGDLPEDMPGGMPSDLSDGIPSDLPDDTCHKRAAMVLPMGRAESLFQRIQTLPAMRSVPTAQMLPAARSLPTVHMLPTARNLLTVQMLPTAKTSGTDRKEAQTVSGHLERVQSRPRGAGDISRSRTETRPIPGTICHPIVPPTPSP